MRTGDENGMTMTIVKAVDELNELQKGILVDKVVARFGEDLTGRTFAIWGLAFKPNTDDMREAPSITTIKGLLSRGAKIRAYDPEARETAEEVFGDTIEYFDKNYPTCEGADALLVVTEWNEFRRPNYDRIKQLLKQPVIIDGRNLYTPDKLREIGFEYYCVGRPAVTQK